MKLALAAALTILALPLAAEEAPGFDQLDILGARAALLDGRVDDAIAVLKPAAEAGDPRAQAFYGSIFDFGDTGEFDAEEALRWYRLAADQGYPQALYFSGNLHRYGTEGFEADPSKSIEWYERAIALDYGPAFGELGDLLVSGDGVPADEAAALVYLRRGADLGDILSSAALGRAYLAGRGVGKDEAEARRYLLMGASGGNMWAQNDLGWMLAEGKGGPKDLVLAEDMLRRAMTQGLDLAGQTMAEMIAKNPDLSEGPLAAPAHCLWATTYASEHDPGEAWRAECVAILDGLTPAELKQADGMARSLVAAP